MLLVDLLLGVVVLIWAGAFLQAVRSKRDETYQLGAESPRHEGSDVAIIIPARDEAAVIEECLRAVLSQELEGLRVVVLDDGSTDGTHEILQRLAEADSRLLVISGGESPLPQGWLGKPWACQRAAEKAIEEMPELRWMLFIDADVCLQPAAASVAVAAAEASEADLLSALGNFELRGFWEKVLQPVVAGLILAGNDLAQVNDEEGAGGAPLANGQFLLFRRSAWESIGGHRCVAHNVLDDVGLATSVLEAGLRYRLFFMSKLFTVRMYDSLGAMWAGWSKNLFAGLGYSWLRLLWVVTLLICTTLLPLVMLILGAMGIAGVSSMLLGAAGLVSMMGVRAYLDRNFEQDLRFVPTLPLGSIFLVLILVNSAIQTRWGRRTWKGRTLASRDGAAPNS
jgi:chlorobactene glucosyltransferase